MFNLYLSVNVIVVLIGLFMIQNGDLGGYPNDSVYPYLLYMACFWVAYKITQRFKKTTFRDFLLDNDDKTILQNRRIQKRFIRRAFIAMILLVFIVLTLFNGIAVLKGQMDKGEFRSQMGYFGFLLAIPIKFLFPALFTRVCFGYYHNVRQYKNARINLLFIFFLILCITLGLSNGDKSMTITTILCGLIALLWERTELKHILIFSSSAIILLLVGFFLFDNSNAEMSVALNYLRLRTFSISAEAPWKIWELYRLGNLDFNYPITLANIFGAGGIELLFGVSKYSSEAYMYSFTKQMTAILYPDYKNLIISGEFNTTATAYVEGLVIAGIPGIALMGFLAGWFVSLIKNNIAESIFKEHYAKASIYIVYFVYAFLPWFQSGGITTLIHPVTLAGIFSSYFIIRTFERFVFARKN